VESGNDTRAASIVKIAPDEYQIHTSILIDAPSEAVWSTLTDWENLRRWSSSFIGLHGDFEPGGRVEVSFKILGLTRRFDHDLTEFDSGRSFAWSDPFLLGMVDDHRYLLERVDASTTRFVHTDRAKGGAARLVGRLTAAAMKRMHDRFNAELRAEVARRRGR
jgi:uncharacterized protein YndB with AHSA1/START domain